MKSFRNPPHRVLLGLDKFRLLHVATTVFRPLNAKETGIRRSRISLIIDKDETAGSNQPSNPRYQLPFARRFPLPPMTARVHPLLSQLDQ